MTATNHNSSLPGSGRTVSATEDAARQECDRSAGHRVRAWHVWVCLALSAAVAVITLHWFGLSLWTALFIAALLACPAVMAWGYIIGNRPLPFPIGPVPQTRGMTTNWAAPYYDTFCHAIGLSTAFRARTLAAAGLRTGEHVLDVGCGTGVLTRKAAAAVGPRGSALGIDPAPDMIRIARQNAATDSSSSRFLPGAIEYLPAESESVDVVLVSLVLSHLPPDLKASGLREIFRVLRPGGRLVIVDIDHPAGRLGQIFGSLLRAIPHFKVHADGHTPALIDNAGFTSIAAVGTWAGMLTFWTARKPGSATAPSEAENA